MQEEDFQKNLPDPVEEEKEDIVEIKQLDEKAQQKAIKKKKAVKMTTKFLAYVAVLTALSVLANIYDFSYGPSNAQRIGLVYFVNFTSGAFMGPLGGFLTGVLGDFLGFLIKPSGTAYNPVIMIVSGLSGLIPGLVFWLLRRKVNNPKIAAVAIAVSMVLVYAICSSINTICIYYYFTSQSKALGLYFGTRMMWQLIPWAINTALAFIAYYPLKKVIKWK